MKRGKKKDLKLFQNFGIEIGTIDNKNPKSVYLTLSTWADPVSEEELNYGRIIRNMRKHIKQTLNDYLSDKEFIVNRTLVDLDIRESGVKFGKRSYVNCEITLYQVDVLPINSEQLNYRLTDLSCMLTNKCFEENNHFKFHKRKKK